jgi:winged helix DNA-binding protein
LVYVDRWLADAEDRVDRALARRGTATGAQLADDEPALRTLILAKAPSDRPQNVTTPLLTLMSADGRLVRGTPTGPWTSRHHRWEPVSRWWPEGLPLIDTAIDLLVADEQATASGQPRRRSRSSGIESSELGANRIATSRGCRAPL